MKRTIELGTAKIIAEVEDGVGWLAFNQPEKRNAVSLEMWRGLAEAGVALEADPEVRVVVLYGKGGSFTAGADISEFDKYRSNAEQMKSYRETSTRGYEGLSNLSKPLVAMVEGFCIGGGLALALNADIRFAASTSRFGIPAAKLGLGYEYPGLATLARLVGPSAAKDIMFTARQIEADEALRLGLVNFVVDDAQLEARVREYAAAIAANAPLTVRAAKAAMRVFERYSLDPASVEVDALVARCFDSEDYAEGRQAFKEKRKAVFKGR